MSHQTERTLPSDCRSDLLMIDFVFLIWGGRYARFCALMMITQALVRFYEAPWQQQPLTASTSKKSE